MTEPSWAAGWYVRKRHTYEMQTAGPDGSVPAACSRYTRVFPNGLTSRGCRDIPIADSSDVMALPACKLCLRHLDGTR